MCASHVSLASCQQHNGYCACICKPRQHIRAARGGLHAVWVSVTAVAVQKKGLCAILYLTCMVVLLMVSLIHMACTSPFSCFQGTASEPVVMSTYTDTIALCFPVPHTWQRAFSRMVSTLSWEGCMRARLWGSALPTTYITTTCHLLTAVPCDLDLWLTDLGRCS